MPEQARMPQPLTGVEKQPGLYDPAASVFGRNKTAMQPVDNAGTFLSLGAGTGAFGGFTFFVAGHICPICLVATPLLLGAGLYQKFIKREKGSIPNR